MMAKKSSLLEQHFVAVWNARFPGEPSPTREYEFAKEALGRKWRFDFCWPAKKLAVEIDGGVFIRGGHNRGVQMTGDHEKAREAVKLGWRILKYTTLDLRKKPMQVVEEVHWLLSVLPSVE